MFYYGKGRKNTTNCSWYRLFQFDYIRNSLLTYSISVCGSRAMIDKKNIKCFCFVVIRPVSQQM